MLAEDLYAHACSRMQSLYRRPRSTAVFVSPFEEVNAIAALATTTSFAVTLLFSKTYLHRQVLH